MKRLLFASISLLFILASCEQNEIGNPEPENYFPLAVGNYWIYDIYKIDANGRETLLPAKDTLCVTDYYISKGDTFFVLENRRFDTNEIQKEYLRESNGNIIHHNGKVKLSYSRFNDTLNTYNYLPLQADEPAYKLSYMMERAGVANSPVGNTSTILQKVFCEIYTSKSTPDIRYIHNYYGNRIGMLTEQVFFLDDPAVYEKRLVKFYVD